MLPHHQGDSVENPFAFTLADPIITSFNSSKGVEEFDFWGASYCYPGESGGNEIPVQAQPRAGGGFCDHRPSLDGGNAIGNRMINECSPLIPWEGNQGRTCNTSASQAIADGRKELMHFAQSLPESCYELSLKDIVDEGQITREINEKIIEENSPHAKPKIKRKKKQTNNMTRPAVMPRSESMESRNFMIKLFLPDCIVHKKKSGNHLEESLKPNVEEFRNHESKGFLKSLFNLGFQKKNRRQNRTSGSNSGNSSRSSSTYRHASGSKLTGCLPFCGTKCRAKEDRGCLF